MSANDDRETTADGGYVHRPDDAVSGDTNGDRHSEPESESEPEPTGFGAQGWILVAAVVSCFLVIPGAIYLFPTVLPGFGLGFVATFLVLPLIPAVILGLVAVWSMTAAT